MIVTRANVTPGLVGCIFLALVFHCANGWKNTEYVRDERSYSEPRPHFELLHARVKRDVPAANPPSTGSVVKASLAAAAADASTAAAANFTTTTFAPPTPAGPIGAKPIDAPAPAVSVTKTPLLGVNGTGILRVNLTGSTPRVSDPIDPDANITDTFLKETPEKIKAEQNITNLTFDHHNFYNSTFIGNVTYFNEHWANITEHAAETHTVLSNSHRRASTIRLNFDFPFYGMWLRNVTVATGGFIYTGEHVHNWLAATQYIAPLMANFDTTLTNDSAIKQADDGEKYSVFWENVALQDMPDKKFTFAVTLYKNGDIVFAYKHIPVAVQAINDTDHPVKVGISDAYFTDRIMFFVRRKTIYEYHRVNFKSYDIVSGTMIKLTAMPTCLQYDTCTECVNHNTGFDCSWCPTIRKCSSGTDRNKQDWLLKRCDKTAVTNESSCPILTGDDNKSAKTPMHVDIEAPPSADAKVSASASGAHGGVGAVASVLVAAALVAAVAAWGMYAFKNPHTRSGQLLIKYRPSQWSWRRGEARYTAATIHM